MTACIAPKPGVREMLCRADPSVRLKDYQRGLEFWLKLDEPRIGGVVFADNSGYPLDVLQQSAEKCTKRATHHYYTQCDAAETSARPVQ